MRDGSSGGMGDRSGGGSGGRFLAGRPHPARGGPVEPSLEAMATVLGRLGDPQLAAETVHVTGTNGKTSTARAVAALVGAAGRRVGLYTSPHLRDVTERVELEGRPIDPAALEAALSTVARAAGGVELSFFEAMTAAAFVALAEAGVEVAVVEVGILGRYDATNLVRSEVAVVTNVGHDHLDYAGPAPGAVAREKAGIVKATTRAVVLGDAAAELVAAVDDEVAATGSPARPVAVGRELQLAVLGPAPGGLAVRLDRPGGPAARVVVGRRLDAVNALTALAAAEASLGQPIPPAVVAATLDGWRLAGRGEVRSRSPLVVVDVAHNPEAAAALRATVDDEQVAAGSAGRPIVLVVAMSGARPPAAFLEPLVRPGDLVVACLADGRAGAVDPAAIAGAAAERGGIVEVVADPAAAVAAGRRHLAGGRASALVVTGSFAVVAAADPAGPADPADPAGPAGLRR